MNRIVFALTLFSLTLLTGCMVGPDFVKPEVETPEQYRYDLDPDKTANDLRWWELFNDPDLYQLVTAALENNKDLKIAISRMEEAAYRLGFTRADQLPGFTIEGGATTGTFNGGNRSKDTNNSAWIGPTVNWEIDFWGKFRRSTEASRAELLASRYAVRAVELSLVSEVVSAYYLLLDYRQRLEISKSTLTSREEGLDIIQKRFDRGIIPELDVNQAQIQREIAAAAIPRYRRLIAQTENAISILLGRLPSDIDSKVSLDDQQDPPYIPSRMPSQILERRPDIGQSLEILHAENERIGVAVAQRFPAINLNAMAGLAYSDFGGITDEGGVWQAGASLLGPIFQFGKNIRRVDIQEERTRQALYGYEKSVLAAFREVEDALVSVQTYGDEITSIRDKRKAARNANKLSRARYDKGISSYLEVLETERQLFEVELEYSETRQNFFNAYVQLYKSLGGGWITRDDTQAGALPAPNYKGEILPGGQPEAGDPN